MGLDGQRVSFNIRIVPAKFRAIPSSFDPSKGGSLQIREKLSVFPKNSHRRDFGFVGKVSSR